MQDVPKTFDYFRDIPIISRLFAIKRASRCTSTHAKKKKVTTNPKNKKEKIKYIFALSKSARSKPELIFDSHSTKQM